ncbi:MAG: LacI family DNA-binding transcriptional regulator [Roseobacter sp.]
MKKMNAPTLEDVARLAGVSTASISRALNDPDKVAQATRKKIDDAIEQLGYTPNFGGRALASNRTNTVGAVIPSMANAMFASGVQAFQEELAKEGVTLLVATTGFDAAQEFQQIRSLVGQGADGLLLIGNERPQSTWDFIDKRRVAHVVTWCSSTRDGELCVGFDNEQAAGDAARRAMDMGHRRIAMICGITDVNDRAKARRDGVVAAVAAYGRGARLTHMVEAPYILDAAGDALAEIMEQSEKPTVVLCANDAQAAGAMVRAREMGLRLPEDLSFVGFDDVGISRVVTPPLATVRVPQIDIGRAAAQLLLQQIAGREDLVSTTFPTEFVQRPSLAPPSKT